MISRDGIVVAIDGPAGSGKSSTARRVASELGYRHLDSGAFYRAITLAAIEAGIPPEQWPNLTRPDLDGLGVVITPADRGYAFAVSGRSADERIRSPEVNAHVSRMAAVPAVRDWLLSALRQAGESGGLVADGRDIGTVVFPEADLKVFLVCAPAERARRRLLEQGHSSPEQAEIDLETTRLIGRDDADSSRAVAPLVQASDAILLDTTDLTFDEQVQAILHLAKDRMRG